MHSYFTISYFVSKDEERVRERRVAVEVVVTHLLRKSFSSRLEQEDHVTFPGPVDEDIRCLFALHVFLSSREPSWDMPRLRNKNKGAIGKVERKDKISLAGLYYVQYKRVR